MSRFEDEDTDFPPLDDVAPVGQKTRTALARLNHAYLRLAEILRVIDAPASFWQSFEHLYGERSRECQQDEIIVCLPYSSDLEQLDQLYQLQRAHQLPSSQKVAPTPLFAHLEATWGRIQPQDQQQPREQQQQQQQQQQPHAAIPNPAQQSHANDISCGVGERRTAGIALMEGPASHSLGQLQRTPCPCSWERSPLQDISLRSNRSCAVLSVPCGGAVQSPVLPQARMPLTGSQRVYQTPVRAHHTHRAEGVASNAEGRCRWAVEPESTDLHR